MFLKTFIKLVLVGLLASFNSSVIASSNFVYTESSCEKDNKLHTNQSASEYLYLLAPKRIDFVAGVYQYENLICDYNGKSDSTPRSRQESGLTFTLETAPEGMQIDREWLIWTAPEKFEGQSFDVVIQVKSETLSDQITFKVNVATTVPIRKEINDTELTLFDPDCAFNLDINNKFSFKTDENNIKSLELSIFRKITSEVNFFIPKHIKRTSCLFRADIKRKEISEDDDYKFTLPLDATLYQYRAVLSTGEQPSSNVWWSHRSFPLFSNSDKSYPEEHYTIRELDDGLYFIGYDISNQ